MTNEQRFKLRSILIIAALLRVTLDLDQDDLYVITTNDDEPLKVITTSKGVDVLSGLTVLPKMYTKKEMSKEIQAHRFPMHSLKGIPLSSYKEIYQSHLLDSI